MCASPLYYRSFHIGILARSSGVAQDSYIGRRWTLRGPFLWIITDTTCSCLPWWWSDRKAISIRQLHLHICRRDTLLEQTPTSASPHILGHARPTTTIRETCSILFNLQLGFARLVPTATFRGNRHGRRDHGASPRATHALNAEDERFDAMAHSRVGSANGTNILR